MAINPAVFGSIDAVKQKSDEFINKVKSVKPRPGHSVRIPGETGYRSLKEDQREVEVLESHWQPFFETIAGKYGLTEAQLRDDFAAL